jgi:hypothetical protein
MTPLQVWLSSGKSSVKVPEAGAEQGSSNHHNHQEAATGTRQQQHHHSTPVSDEQVEQESWSSTIKSMVNSLRPSSTRSPPRRASARHPTPPPSHLSPSDDNELVDVADRPAKRLKLTLKGPKLAAVPVDVTSTNATTIRPPVKLTIPEPHGHILQTINGVQHALNVTEDSLNPDASPATTPAPALTPSQRTTRKTSERRSLRSQDEGPRLKSELAVYFPNYEDIIYDAPKEPGRS